MRENPLDKLLLGLFLLIIFCIKLFYVIFFISDILKRRTCDLEEKKLAIKILEESNSLDHTLDYLKKLKQK